MLKIFLYCAVIPVLFISSFYTQAGTAETDVKVSGAVRLNYAWKDYGNDSNGSFDFELFRLDVDATQGNWFLDAQFRWYQGFEAIHHGEVGYKFDNKNVISVGVTQVPFGIDPYGFHSFWFSGAYYLGFEDDYDTGIKWRKTSGDWTFDAAYFFNSEYDANSRWGRYSFDIASSYDNERSNKEDGQLNARVQYQWGKHTIGTSAEIGRFTNTTSLDSGERWAFGMHFNGYFDNDWNVQAQYIHYRFEAKDTLGTQDNRIALAAFEYPFDIASQAQMLSLNIAKTFTIKNEFVDTVTCYNDHSYLAAANRSGLADSIQNVTGCSLTKGGIYTYIDWIAGKNMWFAGGSGVGVDNGDVGWHSRLNINIGYYF
ncbi:hypothetical protein MHM98_17710 [Psychrobium sp. MM17-31]|uniref:hypothetical protein n=1 Tax=Psychrobium sp. MM17-31 TaxID=2917758 RepID=UPI001EF474EB|nr:hypothetical protein [Psychrobium sp. MM17-31]MCG7533168.1 hypothetical protein [Psychrobium sp. MM17-31]